MYGGEINATQSLRELTILSITYCWTTVFALPVNTNEISISSLFTKKSYAVWILALVGVNSEPPAKVIVGLVVNTAKFVLAAVLSQVELVVA